MRRLLLILAVLGAAPATAQAEVLRGETTQGRPASLRVGDDGEVRSVAVRWKANCQQGGTLRDRTTFLPPFDRATMSAVDDAGVTTLDDPGKVRIRLKATVHVRRTSARRWRGTFRASGVVRQRGRVVNRCQLSKISFDVRR